MKKVSLYVDEEIWAKFKEAVFRKHGSLRQLSNEAEVLLRSLAVEDALLSAFKGMGVNVNGTMSSKDIKLNRPTLRGPPSEEIVRKRRGKRVVKALP